MPEQLDASLAGPEDRVSAVTVEGLSFRYRLPDEDVPKGIHDATVGEALDL
jgi:hypothetical protein